MRRLRVPTIPNMGLSPSPMADQPLQTCDSAIFADAEEEYSHPEKRPTAPHWPISRRRKASHEDGRYDDANYDENILEKGPSTKMRPLTSLAFLGGVVASVEKREDTNNTEKDKLHIQNQEHAAGGVEPSISPIVRRKAALTPAVAGPSRQLGVSHSPHRYSSNDVDPRSKEPLHWNELKKFMRQVKEITSRIRNRLLHDTVPAFHRHTQTGFTFLVANILALFYFLKWACMAFAQFLDRFKTKPLHHGERVSEVCLSDYPSEESPKDVQMKVIQQSTIEKKTEAEEPSPSRKLLKSRNTVLEPQKQGERETEVCFSGGPSEENWNRESAEVEVNDQLTSEMPEEIKERSLSRTFSKTCLVASQPRKQPDAAVHDKGMWISSPGTAEETITAMTIGPQQPSPDYTTKYMLEDQEAKDHPGTEANIIPNVLKVESGPRDNFRSLNEVGSNAESRADGSGSEPFTETESQGGNLAEDLMSQLDQSSMRLEHRESEIILSPLGSTAPTRASFVEADVGLANKVNYLRGSTRIAERPGHLNTEMDQLPRLPGRIRSSRGPTGKLKSDVRIMKESLFRVFGRNKMEPETRFASPRSARKTLALVADMLVKEHGCDVAVRRNGTLKMRCEKTFPGNQNLRVRLAFQSLDAFSCNVIVCRSREDNLQVSTTDYVSFIAALQRSFLNATSEGMHDTHSD